MHGKPFLTAGTKQRLLISLMLLAVASCSRDKVTDAPSDTSNKPGMEMSLPSGYYATPIFKETIYKPVKLSRNERGSIFLQHSGNRISAINAATATVTDILAFADSSNIRLVSGAPADFFMVSVDTEIRMYSPSGSYTVWGNVPGGLPWTYAVKTAKLLVIDFDFKSVTEYSQNGTHRTFADGFSEVYDIAAEDSIVFIFDVATGILTRINEDGSKSPLLTASPDNTDMAFDFAGNLYVNGVGVGFSQIDKSSGALTSLRSQQISQFVQVPSFFGFCDSSLVVFVSWTDSRLTWVDLNRKTGSDLLSNRWMNFGPQCLGPDDALYGGKRISGSSSYSQILRCDSTGNVTTVKDSIEGTIRNMDFDTAGILLYNLASETAMGTFLFDPVARTTQQAATAAPYEILSFRMNPLTNNIIASTYQIDSATPLLWTIAEISPQTGLVTSHNVKFHKALEYLHIGVGPDGTVYGFGAEEERFFTGPVVEQWIFRLDLQADTAHIMLQVDKTGCCPASTFSVDPSGSIYLMMNPESRLYHISPGGAGYLFASNLPVDCGGVFGTAQGLIYLNTPGVVYLLRNR